MQPLCYLKAFYFLTRTFSFPLKKLYHFYTVPDFEAKRYQSVGLGVLIVSFGGLFAVLNGCWI